ncbi:MAG: pyridoxal phosphate-dependent aminotransferase [Amylibacter sp.]|jgi:aspartate/methionine/tyrosine aminotransferase|tara:strand:- start:658 stop:1866 length:1209 start_codon:yes stop_codon:yes gene_type:complete
MVKLSDQATQINMEVAVMINHISDRARTLEASKIREIAEHGMKLGGVLPLWFGEGSWPTNPLIVEAAVKSLRAGNHMYQPNNGALNFRQEICAYSNDLYGSDLTPERITVTPSGMQGLMLAAQSLVSPGDRVVTLVPGWPNIAAAFAAVGGNMVSQTIVVKDGKWVLDVDALLDALTPDTKAVVINSPNNPTGWTMRAEDQKTVLAHCRKHGIWIVADDVYSRLYRHGRIAPSFLSIADKDDLLISVNSFSKSWSMTGWRLGWIVAPAQLEAKLGQLTEFNTSCTSGFVQDAGIVALREGEPEVKEMAAKINTGYEIAAEQLAAFERVEFIKPDGAFYCFFRIDGVKDSSAVARKIMEETKVGLAPGIAFGAPGEGHLRLCYARPREDLEEAFSRLAPFLKT